MSRKLHFGVAGILLVTFMCGVVLFAVAYTHKELANDPQISLAKDTVHALEKGRSTNNLLPDLIIELENGQSLYGVIYDDNLKPISYSATLEGKPPVPPKGVFEHAKQSGSNTVTWQPKDGIRSAIVVARYDGIRKGYVMFGRSVEAAESRIMWFAKAISAIWAASVLAIIVSLNLARGTRFAHKHFPQAKTSTQTKD